MKILVTGGAGFIGSNLCNLLSHESRVSELRVLDDLSTGQLENLRNVPAQIHSGSILDSATVNRLAKGADAIVHLAARPSVQRSLEDPRATHDVNVEGTFNVLEAARASGSYVIVASSSSVYGSNPTLPKVESMATRPMSPYAATKLAAESYSLAWAQSFGLEVLAFRFFNVYGPAQQPGHAYAAVIPAFLDRALRNLPVTIHGTGLQTRDFTYVETVCDVLADAIFSRVTNEQPVNLALGTRTSLLDLVALITKVGGLEILCEFAPPRLGDVPHSSADPTSLRSLFPHIEATPLEEGLRKTLNWMRSTYQGTRGMQG